MKVWKATAKLYGVHLGFMVLAMLMIGPFYKAMRIMPYLYSFFTALCYGIATYSLGWNCGNKDSRRIPGSYPDWKFPFQVAGYGLILPVVILILPFAFPDIWSSELAFINGETAFFFPNNYVQGTCDFIFKLWFFHLEAFLGNRQPISYILAVLYQPVLVIIGYFVGLTRFRIRDDLLRKLVYTTKKDA